MPGIVGYVGGQEAAPILLGGLGRLAYQGYDSAGLAVQDADGVLVVRRTAHDLAALEAQIRAAPPAGHAGLGRTRWATHGAPSEKNAPPLTDCGGELVLIHQGIVENYAVHKATLQAGGHVFRSETDSEVLAHLIEERLSEGAGDLGSVLPGVLAAVGGSHTVVAMSSHAPGTLWAARRGETPPLMVGYGAGEMFLASDPIALLDYTRTFAALEPDELLVLTAESATYRSLTDGQLLTKTPHAGPWDTDTMTRGGYTHYTQKEIYEQPDALGYTLRGRLDPTSGAVRLDELPYGGAQIRGFRRLIIVGAGASWHNALAGKYLFERLARLPTQVETATEFRYCDPPLDKNTLVLMVSGSGRTGDSLAALELAEAGGARRLALSNGLATPAEPRADAVIYMHAGPELSLVATKSFTCGLVDLALLALHFGLVRGTVSREEARVLAEALAALPGQARQVLDGGDELYAGLAATYATAPGCLCIGRGLGYPVALQGAHLLKTLAYLHAEGLPAGELVHGALAILDPAQPVIALAPQDSTYPAMLPILERLAALGASVLAIGTEGDARLADLATHVLTLPPTLPLLAPLLAVLPLQLLAYELGVLRGCAIDAPRTLARTIEDGDFTV